MSHERACDTSPSTRVMRLLEDGVPLSLILDVFWPDVPSSREILEVEGLPAQRWWLRRRESA